MSMRKILGRTGLILVVFAALVLGARAFLNYTSEKKLEKFLVEAKAKGLPVSRADLGPACPDPVNARPLSKAAAALFNREYRATTNLTPELTSLFETRPLDEKSRTLIHAAIGTNRRSIDFLLEAAGRSCFRVADYRDLTDYAKVNELTSLLQLIRLLGFEALFRAEAGDVRGGLNEWIKGWQFVRLTMQEPELIVALIAISNAKSLLVVLNRIVDDCSVDGVELGALLKELDVEAWRGAVAGSWKGERVFRIETGRAILAGQPEALEDGWKSRFLLWWARPWVRKELVRQYSAFDQLETLFSVPYYESRPGLNAYDDRQKRRRWYERMIDGADSGISATGLKEAALEALMETARIGLAARIYSAREKHFPAAIADLVPDLLPREPMDPFTGKPFVFRVDKDGLLIYSLGSNEKDDGGRGTLQMTQLVQKSNDDWAWRDHIR